MDKDFFMNNYVSLSSAMEINSFPSNESPDCFVTLHDHFESAISSMVSSPVASNSAISTDTCLIRELIGKLGTISGEIHCSGPPHSNATNSPYNTPLNSPLNLPAMPGDPGFAERAARFSSFGSRSFNGRTTQLGLKNGEVGYGSNSINGGGKLQRVSSSPSLNGSGSQLEKMNHLNSLNDVNSRKRKCPPRGKLNANSSKVGENGENINEKRSKREGEEEERNKKGTTEPPKDYIHVRARRGQATDSHSIAERVRREKISERMKLLQDLVPGCNKVTGKALMLDEIINYVQSLQRQVEFLSMKLASVNPRLEFNMDNLNSKDGIQRSCALQQQHQMYQMEPIYNNNNNNNINIISGGVGPMTINQNNGLQFPPPCDPFSASLPQLSSLCEDDLQNMVQMGFGQKQNALLSPPYLGKIKHH